MLQLPDYVPPVIPEPGLRAALRPRTRLAAVLHRAGVRPKLLYDHLGWTPEMTMRALTSDEVHALVTRAGGEVAWNSEPLLDPSGVRNVTYLITR